MTSLMQDPRIGVALRDALSLDGVGQVRLAMEDSVVPVAIVADVRESLAVDPVNVVNVRRVAAVAAQYSRVALEVQSNSDVDRVILKRLHIVSGATQTVFIGYQPSALIGATTDALPQRMRYSLRAAPTRARLIGDTSATAPTFSEVGTVVSVIGGETLTIDYPDRSFILDVFQQGALLAIIGSTVNVSLTVSAEWVEVPRVN